MVEDAVSPDRLNALRDLTYEFIERSRSVTTSDDLMTWTRATARRSRS
jgi:hypothetical protein